MPPPLPAIALIPARAGSVRIRDKNVQILNGHPLLAYSIAAALGSGVFEDIVVSTDSEEYATLARSYGASTPFLRPALLATASSPDIEWVTHALNALRDRGQEYEHFSILRPTNPFRTGLTIERAWNQFCSDRTAESLRAVRKCKQHPGKMWAIAKNRLLPLLPFTLDGQPWHSHAYQSLPTIYAQTASLEIAKCRVVWDQGSISGTAILPFIAEGYEGFDINDPDDLEYAEWLVATGRAKLPDL